MSYTPDPVIEQYVIDPGTEDDTWGDLLNINLRRLAEAAHGIIIKDVTGLSAVTIDDTDFTGTESHKAGVFLQGAPSGGSVAITLPAGKQHAWWVYNFSSGSATFLPFGSAQSIAVPSGHKATFLVYGDNVWPFYESARIINQSGSVPMAAPLNMAGNAITNLPYPAASNNANAAPLNWVVDYVETRIAAVRAQERNILYPVGCAYINLVFPDNPATYLGFGTWAPWGGGTFLVSAGVHVDTNGTSLNLSGAAEKPAIGSYFTTLSQANLPPIAIPAKNPGDNAGGFGFLEATSAGGDGTVVVPVGSASPFSNMPPISVAYIWRRTA